MKIKVLIRAKVIVDGNPKTIFEITNYCHLYRHHDGISQIRKVGRYLLVEKYKKIQDCVLTDMLKQIKDEEHKEYL